MAGNSKITADLSDRTTVGGEELLDVVVELRCEDGAASAEALRESFRRVATPVQHEIASLGGEVTGEAWINQTLRAKVPAQSVDRLSDLDEVAALDVPHSLTLD